MKPIFLKIGLILVTLTSLIFAQSSDYRGMIDRNHNKTQHALSTVDSSIYHSMRDNMDGDLKNIIAKSPETVLFMVENFSDYAISLLSKETLLDLKYSLTKVAIPGYRTANNPEFVDSVEDYLKAELNSMRGVEMLSMKREVRRNADGFGFKDAMAFYRNFSTQYDSKNQYWEEILETLLNYIEDEIEDRGGDISVFHGKVDDMVVGSGDRVIFHKIYVENGSNNPITLSNVIVEYMGTANILSVADVMAYDSKLNEIDSDGFGDSEDETELHLGIKIEPHTKKFFYIGGLIGDDISANSGLEISMRVKGLVFNSNKLNIDLKGANHTVYDHISLSGFNMNIEKGDEKGFDGVKVKTSQIVIGNNYSDEEINVHSLNLTPLNGASRELIEEVSIVINGNTIKPYGGDEWGYLFDVSSYGNIEEDDELVIDVYVKSRGGYYGGIGFTVMDIAVTGEAGNNILLNSDGNSNKYQNSKDLTQIIERDGAGTDTGVDGNMTKEKVATMLISTVYTPILLL